MRRTNQVFKNCMFGQIRQGYWWKSIRWPRSGYDEYSLLDLYSGFFLLLVPYSENLLLGRVASSSKKAQMFQNILFFDTDKKFFGSSAFSWSRIFASLLFVSTGQAVVFIFCENANISDRPRPPYTPSLKQLIPASEQPFLETCFFLHISLRLSGKNYFRGVSMGNFGPTASNLCYEILTFFLGED